MNRRTNPRRMREIIDERIKMTEKINDLIDNSVRAPLPTQMGMNANGGVGRASGRKNKYNVSGGCCCCPLCGHEYEHKPVVMEIEDVEPMVEGQGGRKARKGGNRKKLPMADLNMVRKTVKRIDPSIPVSKYNKKELKEAINKWAKEGDLVAMDFLTKYRLESKRNTKSGSGIIGGRTGGLGNLDGWGGLLGLKGIGTNGLYH